MKLIIIVLGNIGCWYLIDLESESFISSVIAPLGLGIFLISFLIWLVMFFHTSGVSQAAYHNGDSGGFGSGRDSSGDGDCS